ncbi:DUF1841 family protein [candidate division KSB1 bacterium]|nr:DUF1841 family protein [candidate division KSB1 bacterium]
MIFPEELDNRPFRLLVERIGKLQKSGQPLSPIEQELADLIAQFPETGVRADAEIDISAIFTESEPNPLLLLSAIWQVSKQIRSDSPKGIAKIVTDYFHTTQLKSDDLLRVAAIYLSLYEKVRSGEALFSEKEYLWEVYYALNQDEEPKVKVEQAPKARIQPGTMSQAFKTIARELHDEAGHIKLSAGGVAKEIYEQLPLEWINAMSSYWQCSDQRLKRDKIKEIISYLSSAEFPEHVGQTLSREEKNCLLTLLENENCLPYAQAAREFGPEHNDGYWWTQDAPKSTLGNLRMKGLVAVGEATLEGEATQIVMIPNDISRTIAKALAQHS